jgi:hypothetical protein
MIPEVLHFIWISLGETLPEQYRKTLKLATLTTNFKVVLHTDDSSIVLPNVETRVRDFCLEYNGHKFDKTVDYISHIKDIVRLEVLYAEGGIYSDLDVFWLKHPWHLVKHKCFIGFENKSYKILCNAVMGAEANHPAIKEYLDWTLQIYPPAKYWLPANPYRLWKDRTDVTFLEKKEFFPLRWKQLNKTTYKAVEQSTAIHLYNKLVNKFGGIGGPFMTDLLNYLDL